VTENVVGFEHFYYKYLNSPLVLKDICLQVERGSFTVIIGPSGAGKTTLVKSVAGIVPYYMGGDYAGDVTVLGESVKGKKVSDLALKVGIMLEDYESQLVSLTAGEEVAFSLLNHGFSPEEVKERTKDALADVGLPGREDYQLDELSGGQRQRLALASILAVHPEIIVLDEPVSAMDPEGCRSLYALISRIHAEHGTTFIVVEHRVEFALPYLTHLVAIKDGRVEVSGTAEEAVPSIYADKGLRDLLPELWQIKCGLEEKTGESFSMWRDREDALRELKGRGFAVRGGDKI